MKTKDTKSASKLSVDSSPDEADTKLHDKPGLLPTDELDELDELDAAEAAQFKAEVQGHRHHEVGLGLRHKRFPYSNVGIMS